jgi:hypothetical protein
MLTDRGTTRRCYSKQSKKRSYGLCTFTDPSGHALNQTRTDAARH